MKAALLFVSPLSLALVLGAGGATFPHAAHAQDCTDAERWAEACGRARDFDVEIVFCPTGGLVLGARVGEGTPVRVEIARGRRDAFRRVGGLGVSPIGEFTDWNQAEPSVREGFERVLACVNDDPSLAVPEGALVPHVGGEEPPRESPAPPVPWFLLFGWLACAAVFALAIRAGLGLTPRRATALGALTVATFAGRALLVPFAYVHQNGQGPLWIDYALGAPTVYGPGYAEVFGPIAHLARDPDGAVFHAQALFGALGPALVFLIARRSGARPPLAWALALAVAMSPGFARLTGSESYFAIVSSLFLLGATALAVGGMRARVRDPGFALGVLAAGLLAAQATRIHPIGAVAAATLPLVALVGPGSLRARLRVFAAAAVGIGAIAVTGFLDAFGDLGGGELGESWLPGIASRIDVGLVKDAALTAVLAAIALVVLAKRRARAAVRAAALAVLLLVEAATNFLGPVPDIVHFGYGALFAAPLAATLGASLARIALPSWVSRSRRAVPAIVLALAAILGLVRAPALTATTTDVHELALLRKWRDDVPEDATVVFLGVAGDFRLFVPMHGSWMDGAPSARQLDLAAPAPDLATLGGESDVYYYRSSLCEATEPDTRAWCEDIERTYRLARIHSARLPAAPSMGAFEYAHHELEVGLFRVEGAR